MDLSPVVGAVGTNIVVNFFLSIFQAATALFSREIEWAAFRVFLRVELFFFLFIVIPVMRGKGAPAPQRPWNDADTGAGAEGLEWEVPSPAPWHTFETPPKLNASATKVLSH